MAFIKYEQDGFVYALASGRIVNNPTMRTIITKSGDELECLKLVIMAGRKKVVKEKSKDSQKKVKESIDEEDDDSFDGDDEKDEVPEFSTEALFVSCTCWRALAQYAAIFKKHDIVLITGTLKTDIWNGEEREEISVETLMPQMYDIPVRETRKTRKKKLKDEEERIERDDYSDYVF